MQRGSQLKSDRIKNAGRQELLATIQELENSSPNECGVNTQLWNQSSSVMGPTLGASVLDAKISGRQYLESMDQIEHLWSEVPSTSLLADNEDGVDQEMDVTVEAGNSTKLSHDVIHDQADVVSYDRFCASVSSNTPDLFTRTPNAKPTNSFLISNLIRSSVTQSSGVQTYTQHFRISPRHLQSQPLSRPSRPPPPSMQPSPVPPPRPPSPKSPSLTPRRQYPLVQSSAGKCGHHKRTHGDAHVVFLGGTQEKARIS